MSKSREEDDIQLPRDQESRLPKVVIVSSGGKRELNFDYENAEVVFQSEEQTIPQLFNAAKRLTDNDLFLFLEEGYDFADKESLGLLVDYIWRDETIGVGGAYSNISIEQEGEELFHKFNPPYNKKLYDGMYMMNIPFIVKREILPDFNEEIKTLCLWDGILKLISSTIVFHMPKTIFKITNAFDAVIEQNDLKIIADGS